MVPYLVSDDNTIVNWGSNRGITLPDGAGATYNIGLAPIFFERAGSTHSEHTSNSVFGRGPEGTLLSSTSKGPSFAYRLIFNTGATSPSYHFRGYAFSLRCLVSTNNG